MILHIRVLTARLAGNSYVWSEHPSLRAKGGHNKKMQNANLDTWRSTKKTLSFLSLSFTHTEFKARFRPGPATKIIY